MTEREKLEKVIKGLTAHGYNDCKYCPYWGTGRNGMSDCTQLARDALSLLKAQELCNDCISRKAALDALHRAAHWHDAEKRIETLPTVELKAQEPRLLPVEEVVGYVVLERDKTLWFEFRDGIMEMNTKDIVFSDFICDEDCPMLDDPNLTWKDGCKRDGVIIEEYNDTFRCWTSCPNDERRAATPWR